MPAGRLVHHSGGVQYLSIQYTERLAEAGHLRLGRGPDIELLAAFQVCVPELLCGP